MPNPARIKCIRNGNLDMDNGHPTLCGMRCIQHTPYAVQVRFENVFFLCYRVASNTNKKLLATQNMERKFTEEHARLEHLWHL